MSAILRGRFSNTETGDVRIDGLTFVLKTIEYEHSEIHSGSMFTLITYSDNLASSSAINISMLTPNTDSQVHVVWTFDSSGEYLAEVYSGSTIADGAAATPINHNFSSTAVSTATCKTGVTVSDAGTLKYRRYVASGKNVGTLIRGTGERILLKNTQYVFRLTSQTASSKAHIELSWYEHTPKNIAGTY